MRCLRLVQGQDLDSSASWLTEFIAFIYLFLLYNRFTIIYNACPQCSRPSASRALDKRASLRGERAGYLKIIKNILYYWCSAFSECAYGGFWWFPKIYTLIYRTIKNRLQRLKNAIYWGWKHLCYSIESNFNMNADNNWSKFSKLLWIY